MLLQRPSADAENTALQVSFEGRTMDDDHQLLADSGISSESMIHVRNMMLNRAFNLSENDQFMQMVAVLNTKRIRTFKFEIEWKDHLLGTPMDHPNGASCLRAMHYKLTFDGEPERGMVMDGQCGAGWIMVRVHGRLLLREQRERYPYIFESTANALLSLQVDPNIFLLRFDTHVILPAGGIHTIQINASTQSAPEITLPVRRQYPISGVSFPCVAMTTST